MEQYKIYCTEEQTRKALELGASIKHRYYVEGVTTINNIWFRENDKCFRNPTTQEMIGWIESQEPIKEIAIYKDSICGWSFAFYDKDTYLIYTHSKLFDSRKEATLGAIDKALEYLTNNKK